MKLSATIEAILFTSNKPLRIPALAKAASATPADVEKELESMMNEQAQKGQGIVLIREGDHLQLATSPECSEIVERFVRAERVGELTRPSLETLTIIAYRGPVTKSELEMIRGVNCSLILRNLLIRGLVTEHAERENEPLYRVSLEFLRWLGVTTVSDLPDYKKLSSADVIDQLLKQQS